MTVVRILRTFQTPTGVKQLARTFDLTLPPAPGQGLLLADGRRLLIEGVDQLLRGWEPGVYGASVIVATALEDGDAYTATLVDKWWVEP